jgi:hypothetical protein
MNDSNCLPHWIGAGHDRAMELQYRVFSIRNSVAESREGWPFVTALSPRTVYPGALSWRDQ